MSVTRKATVQYRQLTRNLADLGSLSLKDALSNALRHSRAGFVIGDRATARIADLDQDGRQTLINKMTSGSRAGPVLEGQLLRLRQTKTCLRSSRISRAVTMSSTSSGIGWRRGAAPSKGSFTSQLSKITLASSRAAPCGVLGSNDISPGC
jgi:hypothetical protein